MNYSRSDATIVRYAQWVLKWRWPILVASLALVVLAALGAQYLTFATDYRVFFSDDNPQLLAFDELQDVYTKNDNVLFVLQPADGDPFSSQSLAAIAELTEESWKLPYAIRVDGITNFQHTEAEGDELVVADLVERPDAMTAVAREKARHVAMREPLLSRLLISDSGDITGVNVTVQFPGESIDEVPTTATAARELAAQIEEHYPGSRVYISGIVMINNAFVEAGQQDMMTVVPLMYALIILIMIVLLRSIWGSVSTIMLIFMSAAAALGIAGWLGMQLTPVSVQAPTMIMTLAVADSIHLLITALREMRQGRRRNDAIIESLRVNFVPVFLTSITTAIGFLSLNFSDAPPYRHLGNITALGVSIAFAFSVTFLPALLAIVPIRVRREQPTTVTSFARIADWVIPRARWILGGSLVLILIAAALVPTNRLNDEFVKYFDTSIRFRTDTDFANDHLTGLTRIEHSIGSGEEGGISNPAYLVLLDSLAAWYARQPEVLHVNHLGLVMKRLNMNMHGDDSGYYRVPDTRDLAAQYLLLYEMSLPYGLDLNNLISVDKSSTRFTATLTDVSSAELLDLARRGESWLERNAPEAMHAQASSPAIMFSYLSRRQVLSMIQGTIIAVGLITLAMMIALRSVRYGLLSLLPNVIPMVLGFGAWALMVGKLGLAHSTIVGMTLGIVVDDTVHFLNKYLRARRERGLPAADAIRYAFDTVGRALVVTSVVLVAGFLVLTVSPFELNSSLGQLAAMTIAFALIADFLLLPAVLLLVDRGHVVIVNRAFSQEPTAIPVPITTEGDLTMRDTNNTQPGRRSMWRRTGGAAAAIMLMLGLTAAGSTRAQVPPEVRGRQIAEEVERRDSGFIDHVAEAEMTLRNRHGQESKRLLRVRTLEVADDGDKSLVIFDHPRDVKGTAFLSFTHVTSPDDQWLYLPALKRVKRISSDNKSGPFVGSEFAYEDLSSQEVDKYTYRYLRDEFAEERPMFVVERYSVDENSGYTRQVVWVNAQEYRPERIEYYDRKGELLKTLTFHEYRQYLGQYWRAYRMEMVNHQTGKSTTLRWSDYTFQSGLSDRDFNQSVLKSIR